MNSMASVTLEIARVVMETNVANVDALINFHGDFRPNYQEGPTKTGVEFVETSA